MVKSPLRISFLDPDGTVIHADAAGIGWQNDRVFRWSRLPVTEHCYGLGEKTLPLDKRGLETEMWNQDPASYDPGADPIYSNIPFLLGLNEGRVGARSTKREARGYGIFYDHTAWSRFDLGAQTPGIARFEAETAPRPEGDELRYYLFYGPKLSTVLERYTELTGRMAMPPLWALGYHQNRWSYFPEARVREIARQFRQRRIPCEAIHLDIDYMDGYRCFTWNRKRFPDPGQLVSDLHDQGFRVVTMIDPGIKVDREYWVYEEGLEQGVFCTYPDGSLFVGPVWPGNCCFPDYTSPRVRAWWGELYRALLDVGVDGFWNDMNEPAVFGHGTTTMANTVQHEWEGHGASHRQAHNVYGMQMARATVEGLLKLVPTERPLVISRSVWAGSQRYNMHWLGDNRSDWASLRNVLPLVLNMGLSGLPFTGPDTGGFTGTPDSELLIRWNQLSTFTPFFRNHTATGTGDQEPWALGPECERISRADMELRYRLLPYLYTAFWQAAQTGMPMMRPLFLAYQDEPYTRGLEDEFLFGDAILAAPITEAGRTSRQAYLPPGRWYDFWDDTLTAGPQIKRLPAPLDRLPLLIRAGSVVPAWPLMQHTGEQPIDTLTLHVYPGNGESQLYEDDGLTWAFQAGDYRLTRFQMHTEWAAGSSHPAQLRLERTHEGRFTPQHARTRIVLHGFQAAPRQVSVDGQIVSDGHLQPNAHLCPGLCAPTFFPYVLETETFEVIEIQA
jgi:alpha-glucosidase